MTRHPDPDDSLGFDPADRGKLAERFDSGQNLPGPLGDGGASTGGDTIRTSLPEGAHGRYAKWTRRRPADAVTMAATSAFLRTALFIVRTLCAPTVR